MGLPLSETDTIMPFAVIWEWGGPVWLKHLILFSKKSRKSGFPFEISQCLKHWTVLTKYICGLNLDYIVQFLTFGLHYLDISFNQPTAFCFLPLTLLRNCFILALLKGICGLEYSIDFVKA